jgi:hypothetical protein
MYHLTLILAATSLGAKLLAGVLWAGLIGLTVALVVLMRTKWGHARPLSKCVALSIYAHVLLMTYCYGTHLVIPSPPGDEGDVVHLTLVGADDLPQPADEKGSPWESPMVETPEAISLAEPAKVETKIDTPSPKPLDRTDEPPVAEVTPRPMLDATPEIAKPALATAPIDAANPGNEAIDPLLPMPAPPRLSTSKAVEPSDAAPKAPSPKDQFQELTELLTAASIAEALSSRQDRIATSPHTSSAANSDAIVLHGQNAKSIIHRQMSRRIPKRLADGEPMPEPYRLRVAPDRKKLARKLGASDKSDKTVDAALDWLGKSQSDEGRWSARQFGAGEERKVLGQDRQGAGADADTGITALAVLSLLGAGHTHLEGPYRENVQHALEFLIRSQRADGCLAGEAKLYATMYCHGMATLALSEAYAMTGDHRLEASVKRAAEFSIAAQHSTTGGWRYLPGDPGDMSQFGWQVMALKSAELGGLSVPDKTRLGMQRFLKANTSGQHRGLASYRTGERPSRTMTAEAYACRLFLHEPVTPELTDEMAKFLLEHPPQAGKPDFYYWYYGSLAMFQLQDERWLKWNDALQRELTTRQISHGDDAGSFPTDEVWSGYGGKVYTTSIAALCLEVYYRYLPVYEVDGQEGN